MSNKNDLEELNKFSGRFEGLVQEVDDLIQNNQVNSSKSDELLHLTNNLQKFFRESYEEVQKVKIQELIGKLKKHLQDHQKMAEEDILLLREVMIGEAENYVNNENAKEEWIKKLKEYSSLINQLSSEAMSTNYLFKMTGKSITAGRIVQDFNFYFQQAERIKNFEQSVNDGIDSVETKFLIEILQYKLNSL